MRHNKHRATLGVTREHRAAMLSNLGASLIKHGRIQTTLTKAKALRPFIEKVITKAKKAAAKTETKDAIHLRRLAHRDIRDEKAVKLLFTEKHKDFANRPGGYTRIYKLGARISDAAEMALIELVPADDPGYKKKSRKNAAKAKKAAKTTTPKTADLEATEPEVTESKTVDPKAADPEADPSSSAEPPAPEVPPASAPPRAAAAPSSGEPAAKTSAAEAPAPEAPSAAEGEAKKD